MNLKIGGNKVNPFSVGNPVADLGDAIVGTYGPGGSGQSAGEISVDDGGSTGGSGGHVHGGGGRSIDNGCGCGGCCDDSGNSSGFWSALGELLGGFAKGYFGQ
ncbi:MAG: hypothetical protein IJU92_09045 [Spirochaetaceae bacterium]|nr:hypothetical protein [Spirochaetaceae bacterium]